MIFKNRERTVLFAVLFFLLVIISIQIRTDQHNNIMEKVLYQAMAPYLKFGHLVINSVKTGSYYVFSLKNALKENEELKKEIINLNNELQLTEFLADENHELREVLEYRKNFGLTTVAAHIISRDIANPYQTIIVGKGSLDGIKNNMPVISPKGVVGRVINTSFRTAKVQLITDADSGVAAFLPETNENTIIVGNNSALMEADYLTNTTTIKQGDILLTSGYDEIYPEGLKVCKVLTSEPGDFGARLIVVEPVADIVKIKDILIITGMHEQS